jgi:enoyl-[acyl-carrier protein] reductase I
MGKLLEGKKGIVLGVANHLSIAWACAQDYFKEGATLAFSYLGEPQYKRVSELVAPYCSKNEAFLHPCDVSNDQSLEEFFKKVEENFGTIDFVLHSVAYTDKDNLKGLFSTVSRESFKSTMDISAYSLVAVTRHAVSLMPNGGSIVTMSYYGAEKVIPRYNVMGVAKAALESTTKYLAYDYGPQNIRVNAISAGPIRTLSSSAIPGIRDMIESSASYSPLRRSVESAEVGKTATFLASPHSSGITGEILHVDCGYNVLGMYGQS